MSEEKIIVTRDRETVVIRIIGNFDTAITPVLSGHCERISRDKTAKKILLDFQDVTRIDTSAFACMVGFMRDHLKEGIEIYLKNLKDTHKNYVEILKLSKIIKVV